jgi:hypothetical protein
MNSAFVETEVWPRSRWWAAIVLALGLQVGLVIWLGDRSPNTPRSPAHAPVVFLAENALARRPALTDPLLFSSANPHGFSGAVWMNTPKLEYQGYDWTSPPAFLTLQAHELTSVFSSFLKTNSSPAFAIVDSPEPQPMSPRVFLPGTGPPQSRLLVQGDLERRKMVMQVSLPSWPHTDILSNSVVEVVVDLDGNTVSANLLSSCGLKKADNDPDKENPDKVPDKYALNVARSLQFQSIRRPGPAPTPVAALTWGKLVFEWQTVASPATNLPTQKP